MKVEFDLTDDEARLAMRMAMPRVIERAVRAAYHAATCECGHTRHWHGQEPRKPVGSGACDDCECEAFRHAEGGE